MERKTATCLKVWMMEQGSRSNASKSRFGVGWPVRPQLQLPVALIPLWRPSHVPKHLCDDPKYKRKGRSCCNCLRSLTQSRESVFKPRIRLPDFTTEAVKRPIHRLTQPRRSIGTAPPWLPTGPLNFYNNLSVAHNQMEIMANILGYLRLPVLASSGLAALASGLLYFKQK